MKEITLEKRELLGKKAKRVEADGMVPTVIYNSKGDSHPTQVGLGDVTRLLQESTTSTILKINFDGRELKGLIKDTDVDPITGQIRHVSFFEIDESSVATYEIPVELVGVSPAVKNNMGVLVQPLKSITVRTTLANLVDTIQIDITQLKNPGDTITLEDLELPEGIEYPPEFHTEQAVVSISQLQKLLSEEPVDDDEAEVEDGDADEAAEGEEGADEAAE